MSRSHPADARIGPNAIIRLAEALHAAEVDAKAVFEAAGLARHLIEPPERMVPEVDVTALYAALHDVLGFRRAGEIGHDAGHRTARYLLDNRIPKPAQALLRRLPPRPAARLLLSLVARNAWTFAGSSPLAIVHGRPARVIFDDSPLARGLSTDAPACAFYVGTFQGLFEALVAAHAAVRETSCRAAGAARCELELTW